MLQVFDFKVVCTDNCKPYTRYLPNNLHVIGKLFTQRIERNNLTLRIHINGLIKKTICFS